MAATVPWNENLATSVIAAHAERSRAPAQSAVLPILHALQAVFGHIDAEAIPLLASALNISRADVHGVVSFYHDFRRAAPGRHVLRLCRAEACQAVGAEAVAERVRTDLGVGWHGTSANGAVTLEPVFCLGLCASGPAALVDGRPVGRLTEDTARALIKDLS